MSAEAATDGLRGADLAAVMVAGLGAAEGVAGSVDGAGTACVDVPRERWVEAATRARDGLGLDFMDWLSAVDAPDGDPPGVDVVLHVATSAAPARRMLLRTRVPEADLTLPSLTAVWAGTAWHERETFEMFGVVFSGFEDGSGRGLRSLLLPEGFEGTPLRKSFVLAARAVKPWPGAKEPGESQVASGRKKPLAIGQPDPDVWLHRPAAAPAAQDSTQDTTQDSTQDAAEDAQPAPSGDATGQEGTGD